jgi:Tol biopolymer transport system component
MALSRRAAKLACILTTACTAGLVFAQSAEAVWPGGNGKIVFYKASQTPQGISAQIYSMSSQGKDQMDLSAAGGGANQLDIQPSVSPNGRRIVFTRVDPTTTAGQIWTMKMDGSDQTNISNDAGTASESGPAWTEDGSSILFVRQSAGSAVFGGSGSIWIRRANGRGTPRQLTTPQGPFDANPAMSPDGDLIAFSRINLVEQARDLIVVKADGDGALTNLGPGSKPDWSPDSTRLVYGGGGGGPITVLSLSDPSNKLVLRVPGLRSACVVARWHPSISSHSAAPVDHPTGSVRRESRSIPTRQQIVFLQCTQTGNCQIALMTAALQNPHTITADQPASNNKPDWQRAHGEGGEHDD